MAPKPTVFIVEDDVITRTILCHVVDAMGLPAESFGSAEDFLAAFDVERSGCLISDLFLPGMSGLELQAVLSVKAVLLPVVVISGAADVPDAVRAMHQGAITVLQKPVADSVLRETITRALARDAELREAESRRREILRRVARLTLHERSVMDLLVQGAGNKAIAFQLDFSLRTVEARRQQVLKKMEVNSLPELVAVLFVVRNDLPPLHPNN